MAKRSESRLLFPWETPGEGALRRARRAARPALVVCAVLFALYSLGNVHKQRRAEFSTRAAIATVLRAVEAYRVDHQGRCPAGPDQLVAPPDGVQPYLRKVPTDGWGRPLRIVCPGRKNPEIADVSSAGPTGSFDDPGQIE
ncbi:MAG: type II secretion system protein GspG [Polyangiales bacterium]